MLDKTFDPAEVEPRIYEKWESSGAFQPAETGEGAFCVVIPPPNVTGSLHIGHALNNTLQDVLVRYHRMRGERVLWQPGMDHAGIATQMVVERQLAERQQPSRREMGRDAFVERVWTWKAESGGMILNQLRRLGASCDWSRERFTMDEGLSAAVRKVFVDLYNEGLIYRDKRLVNWDPKFQTAISDLEVESVEVQGHFWRFAYPLEEGPVDGRAEIVVATTRPETMLGDTAVAVNPEDERYKALIGKRVRLPVADRLIPIVADEHADPEQGSGAVKITPAHDFNDFEVGKRHDLPMISVMDEHGRMNDEAPAAYRGLDRFEARKKIVAHMEDLGLLRGVDDKTIMAPYGDRSGVVIEPRLTDQWYVDAKTLAQPAIHAVESGRTKFTPKNWEKTYFEWMRNIQPWCVSRQLWWGHRIPAWYGPDGHVFVALNAADAAAQAEAYYGDLTVLVQDEDVLDTWFSSALWPFSTLGWPEQTDELATFYPTTVLITAFDIIFFWVARMMMQGLHFMGEIPFHDIYIHALVRDEKGQKMSKSKGNVIDPLDFVDGCSLEELTHKRVAALPNQKDAKRVKDDTKKQFPKGIERCGADALRFTLTALAAQGRDIRLSGERVLGYRNFGTKVWNAARMLEMNGCARDPGFDPASAVETVNRWIVGEVAETARAVSAALEGYRFNEAAGAVYRFAWNIFCDWYLELIKPVLAGPDGDAKTETQACAAWARDQLLTLLHPFSPFITEELWEKTAGETPRENLLIVERWPALADALIDADAKAEMDWVVAICTELRSVRAEFNIPPATLAPIFVSGASEETLARFARHAEPIKRLARVQSWAQADEPPKGALQLVIGEATLALPLEGLVDLAAERARLQKEVAKTEGEIERIAKKLSNERFVASAPEEVVAAEREKQADYEQQKSKLAAALERLEAASREESAS